MVASRATVSQLAALTHVAQLHENTWETARSARIIPRALPASVTRRAVTARGPLGGAHHREQTPAPDLACLAQVAPERSACLAAAEVGDPQSAAAADADRAPDRAADPRWADWAESVPDRSCPMVSNIHSGPHRTFGRPGRVSHGDAVSRSACRALRVLCGHNLPQRGGRPLRRRRAPRRHGRRVAAA